MKINSRKCLPHKQRTTVVSEGKLMPNQQLIVNIGSKLDRVYAGPIAYLEATQHNHQTVPQLEL